MKSRKTQHPALRRRPCATRWVPAMWKTDTSGTEAGCGVVRTLQEAGFPAYFAGGCVRDWILYRAPRDLDVATAATPEEIEALFSSTRPIGKAFGVVQVTVNGLSFDVATFRRDVGHSDGRRPDRVEFATAVEDARRRDFTINGLFYDPVADQVLDFVGGRQDIEEKTVRTIGDPAQRFAEDYLRMLRAARFATVLQYRIDPATEEAIRREAENLVHISAERIAEEITRILLEAPRAGEGFRLLRRLGLLRVVLPEVEALAGQAQPPQFHPEGDVFTHTTMMLDAMEHPTRTLALAVLLHDIAKPVTAATTTEPDGTERIRFNLHANIGATMSKEILTRLRLPKRHMEAVAHCVGNHMKFADVPHMRDATLRRLVGGRTFPVELELHRLDCLCSHNDLTIHEFLTAYLERLALTPALPKAWVNGNDVMALGVPEGRAVGDWLKRAYDAQLNQEFGNREELLAWLQTLITAEPSPPGPVRSP